jgi:hypothetical protein
VSVAKTRAAVSAFATYDCNTMTEPKLTKKPTCLRRICWYSLAVVVLSVVGVLAPSLWRHEHQTVITQIERLGGRVSLNNDDHVEEVYLVESEITDSGLKQLSELTNLVVLNLDKTQISDDGLRHLSGVTKLWHLDLGNTQITNEGLRHMEGMKLVFLHLDDTLVTDEGLQHLIGMKNLRSLYLNGTQVADERKMALKKHCRIVTFGRPTDRTLSHLRASLARKASVTQEHDQVETKN